MYINECLFLESMCLNINFTSYFYSTMPGQTVLIRFFVQFGHVADVGGDLWGVFYKHESAQPTQ